jgi:hypothetical protein
MNAGSPISFHMLPASTANGSQLELATQGNRANDEASSAPIALALSAALAAEAGGPPAVPPRLPTPATAGSHASLYLSYNARYSNPMCLLGALEDSSASDCRITVQASPARRSTASSFGSASLPAGSSCGDEDSSWGPMLEQTDEACGGAGSSPPASDISGAWGGAHIGTRCDLEVLTVLPNPTFHASNGAW